MACAMNRRSNRVVRAAWSAGALSVAAVVLALVIGADAPAPAPTSAPRRAHDFAFEDINPASSTHGRKLTLSDLYVDRGLVLQFVASWCKPCRDELPHLQELHDDGGTPVLLVAADEYGHTEGVMIVAERSKLTAPILFVPIEPARELELHYDHEILPATYLIGRDGMIREVHEGAWSKQRLTAAIERQLR
jgi:thiol-disulfide isomerase/thioredoxin